MGRGKRRESREKRDWIPSRNPNSRPELIKFRKSCLGVLPIKLFDLFLSRTSLNSVIHSCLFQFSSYYFFKWGSRKNGLHFITLIKTRDGRPSFLRATRGERKSKIMHAPHACFRPSVQCFIPVFPVWLKCLLKGIRSPGGTPEKSCWGQCRPVLRPTQYQETHSTVNE